MSKELQIKLRDVRSHLGVTQKELAKRLGCPMRTLIAWENNQNTPRGFALTALLQKLDELGSK